jgi:hypothetical protein
VVDALRRKVHEMYATFFSMYQTNLCDRILEVAKSDLLYMDISVTLQQGMSQQKFEGYELKEDGILMYRRKVYVPNDQELKSVIFSNMHKVPYVGHPCYQKTIVAVKKQNFWPGMKKEVAYFIARCLECQKVKVEHRHPASLLHPFPILEFKWEVVAMEFITKFPRTTKQHDSIMVVVDKLTKDAHFIPVKSVHKAVDIAKIYMCRVAKLHGVPKMIVSEKDSKFTSNFWKGLFKRFETSLNFSTTYHPETDGQTERVNRVIEDMMRMYVMDKPSKWEYYLLLVEFVYNNGYHASLDMSPFESLNGIKCNTPVSWDNPADRVVVGPYFLWEMEEHMVKIRENLKVSQYRNKIYSDKGRNHREFEVGDHVFLKVKVRCSSMKLGKCSKLTTCFCGPFEILERIGPVAYMITLPTSLCIHIVFHVSFLKKYVPDANHVIDWNVIQVDPKGGLQVQPICILDQKFK